MSYQDETIRHRNYQEEIELEKCFEFLDELERISEGDPWRLVDNRELYINKRMIVDGLK